MTVCISIKHTLKLTIFKEKERSVYPESKVSPVAVRLAPLTEKYLNSGVLALSVLKFESG